MGEDERYARRLERQIQRDARRARHHSGFGGVLIGTIIAAVGVLLLLENLGVVYIEDVWRFWPVILIVLGVSRAASAMAMGGRIWGGTIAFMGVLFLLHNLNIIQGSVWHFFWPIILIFIGIGMLARSLERNNVTGMSGGPFRTGTITANSLHEWAIFGGAKRRVESQDFEGGEALAIFGGVELDLHNAATKKEEIVIEANAMFGGIDMRVPDNWTVTVRGSGIFGGYEDKTDSRSGGETGKQPHLIITGYAVFGGVSVKN
jgi:predicted membrane protein